MNNISRLSFFLFLSALVEACSPNTNRIWLDDLALVSFSEGIRPVSGKTNYTHDSILIGGHYYPRGVGVQTVSVIYFYVNNNAMEFTAEVGPDDKANKDIPVRFYVIGDKKILFESGEMKVGDIPKKVRVYLDGVKRLGLLVTDDVGGSNNKRTNANWANAQLTMMGGKLPQQIPNNDKKYLLTPTPARTPRINSAKVFGATPGNPFLFSIAASGERPMRFSADNLPAGLSLDQQTGIITGRILKGGRYTTQVIAENAFGKSVQELTIKIGDAIALTPPIGWNGWNCWEEKIDRDKVIASADAMVSKGLKDHGWTYINIDDAWQGERGGKYTALQPNKKFPAFKEMIDHIHSLGLKAGIYSTPYISSYAGYPGCSSDFEKGGESLDSVKINKKAFHYIGKYRFETNDARQMAEWGIDFLKYDWRIDVNSTERMSAALRKSGRDIVFSLSNNAPFKNAADWMRLANMYRTGPDIRDSWTSLYNLAFTLDRWAPYGGPGHWNDPDMMILGNVSTGSDIHPTRLTPDEQYSHVSIFSLLAAPLLIGCPIDQLDSFTLNLLTNDEVIAIDQDPLGKPARLVADEHGVQVWMKSMEDGSIAIGMFNLDGYGETPQSYFRWGDETPVNFELDFNKLGIAGKWKVRDVWRQKDLGVFDKTFKTSIPYHGVVMVRMYQ